MTCNHSSSASAADSNYGDYLLKRIIQIILIAALFAVTAVASAETRIGAVNVGKLMEAAPQAQAASDSIKQRFGSREKELIAERDTLKGLEEQYNKDKDIMSAADREKTEQDLRGRLREFKRKSDAFTEDFNMARNEALNGLQGQVYKAITDVAKKEKFDIVLSESVLYMSDRVDITDDVLARLKAMGN